MEPKHTEQQVKEFFNRSPIDNPLYLKKFIREHPDQKMAWYLLGREYAAQGKEGKAAYCFAQAGEVFEAFEKRKPNVDLEQLKRETEAADAAASPAEAKPDRRRRRTALLGAGLAALLLSASASDAEPGAGDGARAAGGAVAAAAGPRGADAPAQHAGAARGAAGEAGQPGGPASNTAGAAQQPAVWYTAPGEAGAVSSAAAAQATLALLAGSGGEAIAAAGAASPDGRWVYWQAPTKLLFWLGASDAGGARNVRPLDPQACSCQPADAAKARSVVNDWQAAQEEGLVLRSAIIAYKQRYGIVPQQPEQLVRAYPDNLLPGLSPSMQELFPRALQQLSAPAGSPTASAPATPAAPAAESAAAPAAAAVPSNAVAAPLTEPLRIVVDKHQHRLALLSGNRIVRLYEVGLGGDKTPDGEFAITEKVRNPNNKSNGEFGSRGMTLSDTLYAIHGTNKPSSIGKDESHGCIRMRQNDIEELYDMVPQGTKVAVGSNLLPDDAPLSGQADEYGAPGKGKGKPAFRLPLQTTDSNPNKVYKWLD